MIEPQAYEQAVTGASTVSLHQAEATPGRRPAAIGLAVLSAVAGTLVRLVPHTWNLTPSFASEFFAGARLRVWQAFGLALGMRALGDLLIYFFPFPGHGAAAQYYTSFLPWVYLSVVLNVGLGRLVGKTETGWKIGGVTLLAALQFFVITNFGTWASTDFYPKNLEGLTACFVAALGFFKYQLISYVVFVPVLFGAHAALTRSWFPNEQVAPAKA
jgi:hypothetical protein